MDEIYNDLIMQHATFSPNKRTLENYDLSEHGHNPSCGDEITLELKLSQDKKIIEDIGFTGEGCAISTSSASIMIDTLKGKTVKEAKEIIKMYLKMIKREEITQEEIQKLKEAYAFKNISNMPARVKCALLSWHTLEDMLNQLDQL